VLETPAGSTAVTGAAAWKAYYPTTRTIKGVEVGGWSTHRLQDKVGAFVEGGANFLGTLGIPLRLGIAIIAVLVASFAATTLDTATRLQRYVIQELAGGLRLRPLTNKYAATAFALVLGGGMAMIPGPKGVGTGGLILWPLFGATNQLLAGLAFLVIVFYLWRRNQPIWFAAIPLCIMVIMPAWALGWNLFHPVSGWVAQSKHLLVVIGLATMGLQLWMVVEAVMVWPRAKGVLEDALPPLPSESGLQASGGRSC
jgi:carbon starvation protein